MKFIYCPTCGKKTTQKNAMDDGLVNYCQSCEKYLFDVSYTAIITAIVNQEKEVILIKQSYIGDFYVLVAGFVTPGEDFETACIREVKEEIGQDVLKLHYVRSFYFAMRDQTMVGFIAEVEKQPLVLSQEVASAGWYSLKEALELVRRGSIAHQLIEAAYHHYFSK